MRAGAEERDRETRQKREMGQERDRAEQRNGADDGADERDRR
jgi:hypothetical protein